MLKPPLPITSTFLTSTRLFPGFTTPLARYECADGAFWASDANRRNVLENVRNCCGRHDEGTFWCNRNVVTVVERSAPLLCEERARAVSAAVDEYEEGRYSAQQR